MILYNQRPKMIKNDSFGLGEPLRGEYDYLDFEFITQVLPHFESHDR